MQTSSKWALGILVVGIAGLGFYHWKKSQADVSADTTATDAGGAGSVLYSSAPQTVTGSYSPQAYSYTPTLPAGYHGSQTSQDSTPTVTGATDNSTQASASTCAVCDTVKSALGMSSKGATAGAAVGGQTSGLSASSGSTAALVDAEYMSLFGRHADQAGLDYWVGQIGTGAITKTDLANTIAHGAQSNDITALHARWGAEFGPIGGSVPAGATATGNVPTMNVAPFGYVGP